MKNFKLLIKSVVTVVCTILTWLLGFIIANKFLIPRTTTTGSEAIVLCIALVIAVACAFIKFKLQEYTINKMRGGKRQDAAYF